MSLFLSIKVQTIKLFQSWKTRIKFKSFWLKWKVICMLYNIYKFIYIYSCIGHCAIRTCTPTLKFAQFMHVGTPYLYIEHYCTIHTCTPTSNCAQFMHVLLHRILHNSCMYSYIEHCTTSPHNQTLLKVKPVIFL